MKAQIKFFISPDADLDRTDGAAAAGPALVQMLIGPSGGDGAESFSVLVCTVQDVARIVREQGPLLARHHLIVDELTWGGVKAFLTNHVESLVGEGWPDLAEKLSRIGKWEFEDYGPSGPRRG